MVYSAAMEIATIKHPHCIVVQVTGPLDQATAPGLETVLATLADEHKERRVIVDLAGVPEMSSAGLRVLISAAKRLRSSGSSRSAVGGDLRLAAPSPRVTEVLDLAGLLTVLRVYDTKEEAVSSFLTDQAPSAGTKHKEAGSEPDAN